MEVNGSSESVPPVPESEGADGPTDFETAVSATGFGIFNVLLVIAVIPAGWTSIFDTSTFAFVMPSAECDLDLTLFRKGMLAGIPYAGMICTALVWDFMADRMGRKYPLLLGLVLDALCNLFGSASPNYYVYLAMKFINGIVAGGPFAILITHIAEFHGESNRAKVLRWAGLFIAIGNIGPPVLATALLPLPWSFSLFNNRIIFNSWRIYLLFSSLPTLLGILAVSVLPESPKFLMTRGKHEDALKVLRRMYSMNTGKSRDSYPIKTLAYEAAVRPQVPSESSSPSTGSLFAAPYLLRVFMANLIIFACMSGLHVMKMWLPQFIVILNNFDPNEFGESISVPTICEKFNSSAIESFRTDTALAGNSTDTCIPMIVSTAVYINASIIATSAVLSGFVVGIIVTKVGKKSILVISLVAAALCYFSLDQLPTTKIFLILCSAIVALTGIATNTITAMIIEVFPTTHRATAIGLTVMTGRLGALSGNLLYSILLDVSCNAPFYYNGGFLALASVMAIFLSNESEKPQ